MKHWILILIALLTVLSSVSEEVTAAPQQTSQQGSDTSTTVMRRLDTDTKAPRLEGRTDPPLLRVRSSELSPTRNTRKHVFAQAAEPTWFLGPSSHTYRFNVITGAINSLTDHRVGYWGSADGSYPKVGDLFYGSVWIANVGTINTAVASDIGLPPNTSFDIDANDPNKRVQCFLWNFQTNAMTELTGADCDQTPSPGTYGGAHFAPSSSANNGVWWIAPGQGIIITFPISSRTELNGMPAACLIGSVFAAGALGDGWDRPRPTDTCPLPDGHGASQGVFVAPGSTTVTPPPTAGNSQSTPSTKVKKCKKLKDKQKRKKCLEKIKKSATAQTASNESPVQNNNTKTNGNPGQKRGHSQNGEKSKHGSKGKRR